MDAARPPVTDLPANGVQPTSTATVLRAIPPPARVHVLRTPVRYAAKRQLRRARHTPTVGSPHRRRAGSAQVADTDNEHTSHGHSRRREGWPKTEREKALDTALGQIEKQFGKGSVMRMGDNVAMGIESIPTGALSLDLALGIGGLPRGRIVEIYGPESSGKSTLAMHAVAEAQRNGGICAYIDAEHAMDPVYARAIGVNVDDLLISQPDTGEQALEIADMLIRSGALDVLVIDSVAALTPRAEIEGEMGDTHVGLQARLMSQALRKLTGTLNEVRHHRHLHQPAAGKNRRHVRLLPLQHQGRTGRRHHREDRQDRQPAPAGRGALLRPRSGAVVPKRVVNWFDNGKTDKFLQVTVAKPARMARPSWPPPRTT